MWYFVAVLGYVGTAAGAVCLIAAIARRIGTNNED